MNYTAVMSNGPLLHNSICLGAALVVLLLLALGLLRGVLRLSNLFLGARVLGIPQEAQRAWRQTLRGGMLLLSGLTALGLIGGVAFATWQKIRLADLLRAGVARMQTSDRTC